jgi:hypothetical protein
MNDSQPLEPADAFAQLGRTKLGETDLDGVLDRVAHLAKRTLAGADEASVTLVTGKDAHTAAYTGQSALTPRRMAVRARPRALPRCLGRLRQVFVAGHNPRNLLAGLGGQGPAGRSPQFPIDRFADP